MGMIECKLHGLEGFYEVCEHIWEGLENESIPEIRVLPNLGTKICVRCFDENNAKEIPSFTIEELLEMPDSEVTNLEVLTSSVYGRLKRKGICCECFHEKQLKDARKHGKELPFEPFENTLLPKDRHVIARLEKMLKNHYAFEKSTGPYPSMLDAVFLRAGGIKKPFTIEFYYVVKKEDQDLLLGLIDKFFEDIRQKQRKVSFYESENWITKQNPNGTGSYREESKLLLEKIVK
jgi:hypothetical protein